MVDLSLVGLVEECTNTSLTNLLDFRYNSRCSEGTLY